MPVSDLSLNLKRRDDVTENITQLTAEAIRKSGLDTADNIRSYAKKAREEGESMAKYADEVADAVVKASSLAADRISGYLQRCEDARSAMQQHEALLTKLPDNGVASKALPEASLRELEESLIPQQPRRPIGRPPEGELR
jgi:hypothetical protein